MKTLISHWVFLGILLGFLSSCSPFASKKPPLVLIMVEGFSEQDFLCADQKMIEGLDSLIQECESFLRFTHSFSPSPLIQASLATLMTGKGVEQHGVTHNGSVGLAGEYQTLAEKALDGGMRTAFFSGGLPLVSKFGLRQGYEIFNDSFSPKKKSLFRPVQKTFSRGLRWIDEEVGRSSFFMSIYIPDLLYRDNVTENNYGEERPRTRISQLQEVYESVNELIFELKKRERWENSHVVVLGLNGERSNLISNNALSAQYLHVPLQIKLAKSTQSNISELRREVISFSRLGEWMQTLVAHKPSQGSLLFSPHPGDNFIPQVSHWKQWLGLASWPDIGLRKRQYLFSFLPKFKVFDSFADKKETEALSEEQVIKLSDKYEVSQRFHSFYSKECYNSAFYQSQWKPSRVSCPKPKIDKEKIRSLSLISQWSESIWDKEMPIDQMSQMVSKTIQNEDVMATSWLAYHALYQKKWTSLFDLGRHQKNKPWMLVAQRNLNEVPSFEAKGCLKFFIGEGHSIEKFYKFCQDSGLRKVVEGLRNLKNKKRASDSFWSQVSNIRSHRQAKNLNLKIHFLGDVRDPFNFQPSLAELYFFLPENSDYQKLIETDKT